MQSYSELKRLQDEHAKRVLEAQKPPKGERIIGAILFCAVLAFVVLSQLI